MSFRRRPTLRATALLFAGAAAVHELRYAMVYSGDAGAVVDHQGHASLAVLTPAVGSLLAMVLAQLVVRALRPVGPARGGRASFVAVWSASSAALTATYFVQELIEGWATSHHAEAISGVVGHGGWTAVPLALVVGAVVALVLRAARHIERAGPPQLRAPRLGYPTVPQRVVHRAAPGAGAGRRLPGASPLAGRPPSSSRCSSPPARPLFRSRPGVYSADVLAVARAVAAVRSRSLLDKEFP